MVYTFFDKKIGSGTKPNVNEKLPQELRKTVIKKFKRKKCIRRLRIIFGQQI